MMEHYCMDCGYKGSGAEHACITKQKNSSMNREEKIRRITAYLMLKVEEHDWHAVSDAANDIRVLEGR